MSTAERKTADGKPWWVAPSALYLTPADAGRSLTLEEFEHAVGEEGWHYELIDGKLEVTPLPDLPHDMVVDWLGSLLHAYKNAHPEVAGYLSTRSRVFVPNRPAATCPEPDLTLFRNDPKRLPPRRRNWRNLRPILVVEVLSEGASHKDVVRNVELYSQIPSVREYWVFDPQGAAERLTLTVRRKRGRNWQRAMDVPFQGTYETRLLPGFRLTVDARD
jgi:Uma2 family endonuclease